MKRQSCNLAVAAALTLFAPGVPLAAPPFQLTTVFDTGGGGCVGETRIYEATTVDAARRALPVAGRKGARDATITWTRLDRSLSRPPRYFLTTIGCGADRVAISLGGHAHVLERTLVESVGEPVTYVGDDAASPRVRIDKLATLHSVTFDETECTQRFDRVRVRIDFENATRVVSGVAINACP